MGVRQACSVYFKNYIEKFWMKREDDRFTIATVDREFIQLHLVEAIVSSPPSIRSQLVNCLSRLIRYEFPTGFQGVNEQALHLLQSSNAEAVSAGLLVTQEILRYRSSSSDKNLDSQLAIFMPCLLRIGQQAVGALSTASGSTVQVHAILKTVAKCFFISIRYKFSKHLLSDEQNFVPWCSLLMQILQGPVLLEELKDSERDDLDKTLFWKMKKWAFRAQNRISSRYGSIEEAKSLGREETSFARQYTEKFAEGVMNVNLHVIQGAMNGEAPIPDKVCNLLNEYLTVCVRNKKTWKALRPHVQLIVTHFLFPKICFTPSDEELWADDPQEFLKTVFFSFDDYDSTVSSCSGLILDMVKARKKDIFPMILSFLNSVMEGSASVGGERYKDGALYLLGSLSKVMLTSEFKNDLEPFLAAHVIPELSSQQKFLRLRAAWCIEQYDEVQWRGESVVKLIQGLMTCLEDVELPVRAQACVTIGSLLDQPGCQEQLIAHLGKIVQITLQLTSQVELDSLSYVMDRLVSMYPTELTPYAEELTVQLRNSFLNILESSLTRGGDGEESGEFYFSDTDKMMAAVALLETIETVIGQMCSSAEVCGRVEGALIPLFMVVLERRLSDILSETVSLVESITFKRKSISPQMWPVLDALLRVLEPSALPEFLPDCSTTLENFVSYGQVDRLLGDGYLNRMFAIVDVALKVSDDDGGYDSDSDSMSAVDLLESILLYCRGSIDQVIPHILDLIGAQLQKQKQSETSSQTCLIRFLEIVLNCMYYSASITVGHLHQQGWLMVFLELWTAHLEHFKRVHDLRLILTALASIFHLPPPQLPSEIIPALPALLGTFLASVSAYPKALEAREKLQKDQEAEDAEEANGENTFSRYQKELEDEEEDNDNDNDDDYNENVDYNDDESGESGDEYDDWEDSDELEEDLFFECPLDTLDFSILIRGTLRELTASPQWTQLAVGSMNPEQQALIKQLIG